MGSINSVATPTVNQEDQRLAQIPLADMQETNSEPEYITRNRLIELGFPNLSVSRMSYSKDRNNPRHALALISDESSKDMGGLLQQEGRDFLFYLAGPKESAALHHNQQLSKAVSVFRKVHGGPNHALRPWYVCCGKYEVVDRWQLDERKAYCKLLRLPNQPAIIPQEMYYKDEKSVNALGFSTTRHIYKEGLGMSCMEPCECINPRHIGNFLTPAVPCDICEVCGINGDQIKMMVCECCNAQGREVQACYSCLPLKQLQWLLDDPEGSHHWRCSTCRSAGLRPKAGAVFEETTAGQDTAAKAAGQAAATEALQQPVATIGIKCEPDQRSTHHMELVVLDGAGQHTSSGAAHNQAVKKRSSLPTAGTKRAHSIINRQGNDTNDRLSNPKRSKAVGVRTRQDITDPPASGRAAVKQHANQAAVAKTRANTSAAARAVAASAKVAAAQSSVSRGALTPVPARAAAPGSKSTLAHATGSAPGAGALSPARGAKAPISRAGTSSDRDTAPAEEAPAAAAGAVAPQSASATSHPTEQVPGSSFQQLKAAAEAAPSAGESTAVSALAPHLVQAPSGSATAPAGSATAPAGAATAPAGIATAPTGAATAHTAVANAPACSSDAGHSIHAVKGMGRSTRALAPRKKTALTKQKLPSVGKTPAVSANHVSTQATVSMSHVAATAHKLQPSQAAAPASTTGPAQLHSHASMQAQPQLPAQSPTHAQPQLSAQVLTSVHAQLSSRLPVATPTLAHEPARAPASAQGVSPQDAPVAVVAAAHRPPQETALSQAPVLTASAPSSSAPSSSADLQPQAALDTTAHGLQASAAAATAAVTHAPVGSENVPRSTAPATMDGLTATANFMLVGPHQLSEQQAKQLQATFGDVELMQDLRHMDGDLLNGQLRAAAGLNALQICIVRQVLCLMQQ